MNFQLVFDGSGDSIAFEAVNPDIVEYYLDCIKSHNHFWIDNEQLAPGVSHRIQELHSLLITANSWLEPLFDQKITVFDHSQYLDQRALNLIHAQWVNLQSLTYNIDKKRQEFNFGGLAEHIHDLYPDHERHPKLTGVATKLGHALAYEQINQAIHALEGMFNRMRFSCSTSWLEFENLFGKDRITIDVCNLYLPFRHLGRTQFNKFIYFDQQLDHKDENTFDQLLKYVELTLLMPQTMPYSQQYLDWCKRHNRIPSGDLVPLGNIPDLYDNLANYRTIVYRNLQQKNTFSLHLKG